MIIFKVVADLAHHCLKVFRVHEGQFLKKCLQVTHSPGLALGAFASSPAHHHWESSRAASIARCLWSNPCNGEGELEDSCFLPACPRHGESPDPFIPHPWLRGEQPRHLAIQPRLQYISACPMGRALLITALRNCFLIFCSEETLRRDNGFAVYDFSTEVRWCFP